MHTRWQHWRLSTIAYQWLNSIHRRTSLYAAENSLWWSFLFDWPTQLTSWLDDFHQGAYQFSPMKQYQYADETIRCWGYSDRLSIRWILSLIKPTFKYIISSRCYHLQGPSGVKIAIRHIYNTLSSRPVNYVIRTEIRGYYGSISRRRLTAQLHQHFQDPRLVNYFSQIVNIAIDKKGDVFVPSTGIPRRSALSPFFGALYLSSLDQALTKRKGIQYFRFMDDILILAQTERQYRRAKKILHGVLASLELTLSPSKTRMGAIEHGFHFLGVQFEVSRNPQAKNQFMLRIHSRSCKRALDRVNAMREDSVHPAMMQRYLVRWGEWWSKSCPSMSVVSLLLAWVELTLARDPTSVWIGRGLLPRACCIA